MRWLLFFLSSAALSIIFVLPYSPPHVELDEISMHNGRAVVTTGFLAGGKFCNGVLCVKVVGARRVTNATGNLVMRGTVEKKGGQVVIFARGIE